jgi:5-methylcytosine-specific restriction endonuclease McrA
MRYAEEREARAERAAAAQAIPRAVEREEREERERQAQFERQVARVKAAREKAERERAERERQAEERRLAAEAERLRAEELALIAEARTVEAERKYRLEVEWARRVLAGDDETLQTRRLAIPKTVRYAVWQRDGARCVECGARKDLEFDHIIPVARGGGNTERNLQLLCASCNRRKGATLG